jgi:ribose transport system ATP-binding protein
VLPGEIVGIAGLPGSGANTFNSAILGSLPRRGEVLVDHRAVERDVGDGFRSGFGYIPAERKVQALFSEATMLDNLCAASLERFSRRGVLKGREMSSAGHRLVRELSVVPADPETPVRQLSGGNQQKVVVGRWLEAQARVLLADEPTRGVDVAARLQIHLLLESVASRGGACLIYSSDLDELVDVSDSLLLFHRDLPPRRISAALEAAGLYELMSAVDREGA